MGLAEYQEGARWVQLASGTPSAWPLPASIPRDALRHGMRTSALSQALHSPGSPHSAGYHPVTLSERLYIFELQ